MKDQSPSPHRSIQTIQELLLLNRIYESQKRFAEAVNILDSENIGLHSRIVQNDQAIMNLKATNLGASKMWDEGIAFVKQLYAITDDEKQRKAVLERDDWEIWNLLVEGTRNSSVPGSVTVSISTEAQLMDINRVAAETQKFIEEYIEFNSKSRNAALALIGTTIIGAQKGEISSDHLLSACHKYLDQHKHKLYAFSDIREVVDGDRDKMAKILNYMSDSRGQDGNVSFSFLSAYSVLVLNAPIGSYF